MINKFIREVFTLNIIKIADFIKRPPNDKKIEKFFKKNNIEFDLESIKSKCYRKLKAAYPDLFRDI